MSSASQSLSIKAISSFQIHNNRVVVVGPMSPMESAKRLLAYIEPKASLTKLYRVTGTEGWEYKDAENQIESCDILACETDFGKGIYVFADMGHKLMPMALDYGDNEGVVCSPLVKEVKWVTKISKSDLVKICTVVSNNIGKTLHEKETIEKQISTNQTTKTMATESFLKNATEDQVKSLLDARIPGNKEEFYKTHAADIKKVMSGQPTGVLELANHKDGTLYKCRIHGIKEVRTDRSSYLSPNMIYAREELKIGGKLTIGNGVCQLDDEKIANLKKFGRLNEPLEFTDSQGGVTRRYVAIDKELNRLAFAHENMFRVPQKIWETELTETQQKDLKVGKKIEFNGVKNGEEQKPLKVYYDPVMQTLRFEMIHKAKTPTATQEQAVSLGKTQEQQKDTKIELSTAAQAAVASVGKKQDPKKAKEQGQKI